MTPLVWLDQQHRVCRHRDDRALPAASCFSSLSFDAGRVDDRPPFLKLGPLKRAEGFRRLLVAWENLLPKIGKTGTHAGVRERIHYSGIELRNDGWRRSLGHPKPMPM